MFPFRTFQVDVVGMRHFHEVHAEFRIDLLFGSIGFDVGDGNCFRV